jgi:5-methyltetrahydrofolate--homocysteine methyltransferase
MPVGAVDTAGASVLHLIRRLREELKVNTTCGASNFSFGLPYRNGLNGSFLAMAIGAGMTSAITNPIHQPEMVAVKAADVVKGHDPGCQRWIRMCRTIDIPESFQAAARTGPEKPTPVPPQSATDSSPQISRRMMRKLKTGQLGM